jgi:hypothetical protein
MRYIQRARTLGLRSFWVTYVVLKIRSLLPSYRSCFRPGWLHRRRTVVATAAIPAGYLHTASMLSVSTMRRSSCKLASKSPFCGPRWRKRSRYAIATTCNSRSSQLTVFQVRLKLDSLQARQVKPIAKPKADVKQRATRAHTLRQYGSLTSDQSAILIQARTGHCRLNQYLSRGGLVESALCKCKQGEETIRHVILSCPQWAEERKELWAAAGGRAGDVPFLLGGWGMKKDSKG